MAIRIAIPDNKLAESLIGNYDDVKSRYDLNLLKVSENRILEFLVSNKAQIALLSPIGYGKALNKLDLRIIPGIALSTISFTGMVDIILKSSLEQIKNIIIDNKWNFLGIIAYLILKEKYNQHPDFIFSDNPILNNDFDSLVTGHKDDNGLLNLDVSEEWYDLYEIPLPIYFWVSRSEEYPEKTEEIINSLLNKTNKQSKIKEELSSEKNYLPREGQIIFDFNDEVRKSLEFVLQNLYFHQFIQDIPEIKVLGEDDSNLDSYTIKIDKIDI